MVNLINDLERIRLDRRTRQLEHDVVQLEAKVEELEGALEVATGTIKDLQRQLDEAREILGGERVLPSHGCVAELARRVVARLP